MARIIVIATGPGAWLGDGAAAGLSTIQRALVEHAALVACHLRAAKIGFMLSLMSLDEHEVCRGSDGITLQYSPPMPGQAGAESLPLTRCPAGPVRSSPRQRSGSVRGRRWEAPLAGPAGRAARSACRTARARPGAMDGPHDLMRGVRARADYGRRRLSDVLALAIGALRNARAESPATDRADPDGLSLRTAYISVIAPIPEPGRSWFLSVHDVHAAWLDACRTAQCTPVERTMHIDVVAVRTAPGATADTVGSTQPASYPTDSDAGDDDADADHDRRHASALNPLPDDPDAASVTYREISNGQRRARRVPGATLMCTIPPDIADVRDVMADWFGALGRDCAPGGAAVAPALIIDLPGLRTSGLREAPPLEVRCDLSLALIEPALLSEPVSGQMVRRAPHA